LSLPGGNKANLSKQKLIKKEKEIKEYIKKRRELKIGENMKKGYKKENNERTVFGLKWEL
jgi:hypothetical protein